MIFDLHLFHMKYCQKADRILMLPTVDMFIHARKTDIQKY